jgi:hypothetical protein
MEVSFPAKLTFWVLVGGCRVFVRILGASAHNFFLRVATTGMRNRYGSQPKDGSTAQQYVQYYSASQRWSDVCDDEKRMDLPSSG